MKYDVPKSYFEDLSRDYVAQNLITAADFNKQYIKKGLRNADGTGVVAGVTQICNVHGYIMDEGEVSPIEGELTYRGYSISDIAENCMESGRFCFEETAYLLMLGHLPTKEQLDKFNEVVGKMRDLPKFFTEDILLKKPSKNIMNNMSRAVLSLYSYDPDPENPGIADNIEKSVGLFSKLPVIMAYAYQAKKHYYDNDSLFIHFPKSDLSTAENILHIIRDDSKYSREEAALLDLLLTLHAEHGGGNNSTFTARVLTSSGTDIYSTISSSINSLKGHKHGGANVKVTNMISDIKSNVKDWADEDEIRAYVKKILNKEAFDKSGLVYGIGHAVYTLSDPRAVILRKAAQKLAEENGRMSELKLMDTIAAVTPELLCELKGRKMTVCANVDFYSGFVYSMLGIPTELYTALFAIARICGWCAHRIEELTTNDKIIRPAYKSIVPNRKFVPISQR